MLLKSIAPLIKMDEEKYPVISVEITYYNKYNQRSFH